MTAMSDFYVLVHTLTVFISFVTASTTTCTLGKIRSLGIVPDVSVLARQTPPKIPQ